MVKKAYGDTASPGKGKHDRGTSFSTLIDVTQHHYIEVSVLESIRWLFLTFGVLVGPSAASSSKYEAHEQAQDRIGEP